MPLNRLVVSACFTFFSVIACCQEKALDFKFGNVSAKDFDVSSYNIVDSNTAAVILYESGSTHFVGNKTGWFSYVFTCVRRIKLIKNRAFDLSTIKITLLKNNNDAEALSNIKANTYNLSNSVITTASLDKNSIYSEQSDRSHIQKKFTLPAVHEGSIIEYTYTITSDHLFSLPSWKFQDINYPVLWSLCNVSIPANLIYVALNQGSESFYEKKTWQHDESYMVTRIPDKDALVHKEERLFVDALTNHFIWVKKDVPPFKKESYIFSPENYIDKIEFQLSATDNGEYKTPLVNTWKTVSKILLEEDDFEQAVSNNNLWMKDLPEIPDKSDNLKVAEYIYNYIQNNYTCTDTTELYKYNSLSNVYKKQSGGVRSLNLLLTAILNKNNITAKPVLLSTRENGYIKNEYPLVYKLNYLICQASINGKSYLLDASDPALSFGNLPEKCYNGYARVIDFTLSDSLFLSPDSLNEVQVSSLFLRNDETGKITGTYNTIMGEIGSKKIREKIKKISVDEYFKDLQNGYSFNVDFSNSSIDSLEQKGLPVSIKYDIRFNFDENILYFKPMFPGDVFVENPFKASTRLYTIEMPYCFDKTYLLNMEIPVGYKIDELPKSASIKLNENEGMFEYLIQKDGDHIQLRCRIKLNKATFEPDDYETLRNFFAFVVEKEGEQIVFKKM